MRNWYFGLMTAVVLLLAVTAAAQTPAGQKPAGRGNVETGTSVARPFDPHDLSGIWKRLSPRGGDRSISAKAPALTAEGAARMKENIPTISRDPRVRAAKEPAAANDPVVSCNPRGFPRLLIETADEYHEVIQLKDRILQLWQVERRPREIWMDGRPVPSGPNLDDLGPAWYGHSVGHWEGDRLVVETVGLDERAWVDIFGHPKSSDARIVEHYKRVDPDTLTVQLTLYDSTYYSEPWVSDVKTWKKQPREKATFWGWYGLFSGAGELVCAPMNAGRVKKSDD